MQSPRHVIFSFSPTTRSQFFPAKKKQLRLPGWAKSRLQIRSKTFLRIQFFRDNNDGFLRENWLQGRREKRLCGRGNAGKSLRSAMLHSPGEGSHSGSWQKVSKPFARRQREFVLRQAGRICPMV